MILADGQLIFILNKIIQARSSGQEVKVSKNKFIGILIVLMANICLTLFLSTISCTIAGGYILFSCAEYFLLESATANTNLTLHKMLKQRFNRLRNY